MWLPILLTILISGACSVLIVLLMRAYYSAVLSDIDTSIDRIRELTLSRTEVYERIHGIMFFLSGSAIPDKKDFPIPEDATPQQLCDINISLDAELSLLIDAVLQSEDLKKERGSSIKNAETELYQIESELTTSILFLGERIRKSKRLENLPLSAYFFSGMKKCGHSEINFPE